MRPSARATVAQVDDLLMRLKQHLLDVRGVQALLEAHPDLRADLESFFAGHDLVERLTASKRAGSFSRAAATTLSCCAASSALSILIPR